VTLYKTWLRQAVYVDAPDWRAARDHFKVIYKDRLDYAADGGIDVDEVDGGKLLEEAGFIWIPDFLQWMHEDGSRLSIECLEQGDPGLVVVEFLKRWRADELPRKSS
jgi:hypothetical protein